MMEEAVVDTDAGTCICLLIILIQFFQAGQGSC